MGGWIICKKKGGERYHFLLLVVEFASLNSRVRAPLKLIFIAVISVSSNWPLYISEARKKNKKKTSKNRSIPEDLGISVSLESLLNAFVFHVLFNSEVITGTFLLGMYGIYVLQYLQRPLVNRLWLEGFDRGWKDREGTG